MAVSFFAGQEVCQIARGNFRHFCESSCYDFRNVKRSAPPSLFWGILSSLLTHLMRLTWMEVEPFCPL